MDHGSSPIMVCLISRQTMQNLLPILQHKPQRVVFITTREEDESRKHLETVLRSRRLPYDIPFYVDAYGPDSISQACRQIVERYGAEKLIANLTGGTKVMSLAAFRVFSAAGVPCIYTDTPNRRTLYLHPDDREAEPLDTKVDVLTYLQAHGQLARSRDQSSRRSIPALAAFIGCHIAELDPFLGRLRYEVRDAPGPTGFRFDLKGKQLNETVVKFLQQAVDAGLLEAKAWGPRDLEIVFKDEKARRYLEGEWLEDLVFETVKEAGFDSCAANISLGWKDAPEREMNEIDVAVVHNLRFFYLSCKSGSDPNPMKSHLFELETLSEMAGGLFNHPILAASSARAVPSHLRRRMETLGITYIGPADLPRLSPRLKEIIR